MVGYESIIRIYDRGKGCNDLQDASRVRRVNKKIKDVQFLVFFCTYESKPPAVRHPVNFSFK